LLAVSTGATTADTGWPGLGGEKRNALAVAQRSHPLDAVEMTPKFAFEDIAS
jgi:hypothetical protein